MFDNDNIEWLSDMKSTTLDLNFRVIVQEENGGDDGNRSLAQLLETLEGEISDHVIRLIFNCPTNSNEIFCRISNNHQ